MATGDEAAEERSVKSKAMKEEEEGHKTNRGREGTTNMSGVRMGCKNGGYPRITTLFPGVKDHSSTCGRTGKIHPEPKF